LANGGGGAGPVPVPGVFKLVFLTVLVLTVIFFATAVFLSYTLPQTPTDSQVTLFESCDFAWKACLGAILGLLGGKVAG